MSRRPVARRATGAESAKLLISAATIAATVSGWGLLTAAQPIEAAEPEPTLIPTEVPTSIPTEVPTLVPTAEPPAWLMATPVIPQLPAVAVAPTRVVVVTVVEPAAQTDAGAPPAPAVEQPPVQQQPVQQQAAVAAPAAAAPAQDTAAQSVAAVPPPAPVVQPTAVPPPVVQPTAIRQIVLPPPVVQPRPTTVSKSSR